jgi:nitroreductase/SAM-dependent methyltransferase
MTDFWEILYGRRSIRKFDKSRPVDRELIRKVLDAGIWAPSSCNYQMWDFVVVDDPAINDELGRLSTQMANAPVNIIVAYGRDYSEEAFANIQSASAAIENMSLAAHAVGLGTFWITQTGDPEKVRKLVGLPYERMVVAVLALGYPAVVPKRAPKRRGLEEVAHFNHYAGRPVPSSRNPSDWDLELLRIYQRARVRNGNRHNKPRDWERDAVLDAFQQLRPPAGAGRRPAILDLLPTTGIYSELLSANHRDLDFTLCDLSPEVLEFSTPRTATAAAGILYPRAQKAADGGPPGAFASRAPASEFDLALALFRLENLPPAERAPLLKFAWDALKPGGQLILGYVNARSYQNTMERLRLRGPGPRGVEYILAPDPSIGPFEPLDAARVGDMLQAAGFRVMRSIGYHACPPRAEFAWRLRNRKGLYKSLMSPAVWLAERLNRMGGLCNRRGRLQFVLAERPA